jgi:hypothetical protein
MLVGWGDLLPLLQENLAEGIHNMYCSYCISYSYVLYPQYLLYSHLLLYLESLLYPNIYCIQKFLSIRNNY